MVTCKPIDYDVLCDELLKHYLSPEYYQATKAQIKYVVSKVTATTIDEYIRLLIEGYINVEVREELDKYIDELLENKWFHQWPLVQLEYVLRSIHRKQEINCKKNIKRDVNIDCEIEILEALSIDGWPNAMTEIGAYNYIYKRQSEHSYERFVCLCVFSSRKGFLSAGGRLYSVILSGEYETLPEELQLLVLKEASSWLLINKGATLEDYEEKLEKYDLEEYKKMCRKVEKLQKTVSERFFMRETAGRLFWSDGGSPYDIK